jgi:hypothetical protein
MNSETKFYLKFFALGFFLCLPFANLAGNIMSSSILGVSQSLVEDHNFELHLPFPEQVIDASSVNGTVLSGLPPGTSAIAILTYPLAKILNAILPKDFVKNYGIGINLEMAKQSGLDVPANYDFKVAPFIYWFQLSSVIFINFSALSLIGLMIFILLGNYRLSLGWRVCLSVLAITGTSLFPISTAFGKEGLATLFGFLAFFFIKSDPQKFLKLNQYLLAGVTAGIAITCNYPSGIIAICLLFSFNSFQKKNFFYYLFGLSLPMIILANYHNEYFGSPFATPYQFRLNELWQGHRSGFSGLTIFKPTALWGLTFSFFQGIFIYQPFLFFAVFGIIYKGKKSWNRDVIFFLSLLFCFLIAFSFGNRTTIWSGAFLGWGPRHLVPILPFMVLLLGQFISTIKNKALIICTQLSLLISFGIQFLCAVLGGTYYPNQDQRTLLFLNDSQALSFNPIATMSNELFLNGNYKLLFTEYFGRTFGTIVTLIIFALLIRKYFQLAKEAENNL